MWTMRRIRARAAVDLFTRNYEGASIGRRTAGWRKSSGDANTVLFGGLSRLRENARDLVRNNPYAENAVATVADHTVGWGIVAKPSKGTPKVVGERFMKAWKQWAETPACDSEGRNDLPGLQKLVSRAAAQDGEVLVRRRWRRPEDNLPLPLQLQVIESDYLDTTKDGILTPGNGTVVQGVQYDFMGRREGYWLFRDHPGSTVFRTGTGYGQSVLIPATEILHIFKSNRPGQARGASWFAPIMVRLKDFDEYEDAALMKQKIAACLAVLTTDVDGTTPPLGESPPEQPKWDMLEPGMIANIAAGRNVTVVDPPAVSEHGPYSQTVLQAIAVGFGLTYEDLTGNYQNMPFSAARMSRLRHWARVEDWRWRMLVPQFCDPVFAWAVQAAQVMAIIRDPITAEWTAPPPPMIEPDREGLAYQRNIRTGIQTLSDAIRERGYDPEDLLTEYAGDNKLLDKLGIVLDSDARQTTQQGGPRQSGGAAAGDGGGGAGAEKPKEPTPPPPTEQSYRGNGHYPDAVDRALTALERALSAKYRDDHEPVHVTTGDTNVNIDKGAIQANVSPPNITVDAPTLFSEGAIKVEAPPPAQITMAPPVVTVEPAQLTMAEGAVQVSMAAPPPADIHVDAPAITVFPAVTNIHRGAVQVDVAPAPPAEVHVEGPTINVEPAVTNIAEGAVQVDIAPPPPAQVNVAPPDVTVNAPEVTIAEGAVRVDVSTPVTVEPQVTLPDPKITIIPRRPRGRPPREPK